MKVGVTGATGQLGRAIIKAIGELEVDAEAVAICRSPEKAKDLAVQARQGDYDDQQRLETAFKGLDVVILVAANTPPDVRIGQHQRVINAAVAAGVPRMVYVGIVLSNERSDFSEVQDCSRATEEYLANSGLHWSVGRCGIYVEPDVEALDDYVAAGEVVNCAGEGRCAYSSRPELAEAFAHLAARPELDGQTYNLVGEAVTQKRLVEVLNEVKKTALVYRAVSFEAFKEDRIAATNAFFGSVIAGIYQLMAKGGFDVRSDYQTVVGRPHRSLQTLVEEA